MTDIDDLYEPGDDRDWTLDELAERALVDTDPLTPCRDGPCLCHPIVADDDPF
ncbi:hypothetical protein [Nonomuraea sp. PA05]|uniref:hypothetical protein n=1 Tax=Nonomuraea sp. PA05 TaxID=2604466 RepID=UPI001651FB31|nr:hypothetical protein [Nonomuraea sp. PA05]